MPEPDKKFFHSFGYEPGKHVLSQYHRRLITRVRTALGKHLMGKPFSKDEYEAMRQAVDMAWGAFVYLRDAPSPPALKSALAEISVTAIALRNALGYFWEDTGKDEQDEDEDNKDIKNEADKYIRPAPEVRYAAIRVMRRVCFPMHRRRFPDERDELYDDRFNDFEQMLSEVITAAKDELTAAEEPWKAVSERRTEHLRQLISGLRPIAEGRGWQLGHTWSSIDETIKSPIAELAMILARQLPKEARPKSIRTILRLMADKPPPPTMVAP
jgi:hypothetical protein